MTVYNNRFNFLSNLNYKWLEKLFESTLNAQFKFNFLPQILFLNTLS